MARLLGVLVFNGDVNIDEESFNWMTHFLGYKYRL